jgi:hypothetical protein
MVYTPVVLSLVAVFVPPALTNTPPNGLPPSVTVPEIEKGAALTEWVGTEIPTSKFARIAVTRRNLKNLIFIALPPEVLQDGYLEFTFLYAVKQATMMKGNARHGCCL